MNATKRGLFVLGAGMLTAIIAAYAHLSGREYRFRFSDAEIQAKLNERAPFKKRYLGIFEIVLSSPRVSFVDGDDRVRASADVDMNIYINDEPRPFGGTVVFTGGVFYSPEDGAFFLVEPEIEALDVQGVPEAFESRAESALTMGLRQFYAARPIYVLTGDNLQKRAARLLLREVRVEEQTLHVTLGLP